jgi:hypothetical protein
MVSTLRAVFPRLAAGNSPQQERNNFVDGALIGHLKQEAAGMIVEEKSKSKGVKMDRCMKSKIHSILNQRKN